MAVLAKSSNNLTNTSQLNAIEVCVLEHKNQLREDTPVEDNLTLSGWNIPFVNQQQYLGVIIDKRIT
jgi:hypothetical protein